MLVKHSESLSVHVRLKVAVTVLCGWAVLAPLNTVTHVLVAQEGGHGPGRALAFLGGFQSQPAGLRAFDSQSLPGK